MMECKRIGEGRLQVGRKEEGREVGREGGR